jgi:hypothetical protein
VVDQLVEDLTRNAHYPARFLAANRCGVAVRLPEYRPPNECSWLTQCPNQQIIDTLEADEYLHRPGTEEKDMLCLVVLVNDIIASPHTQL